MNHRSTNILTALLCLWHTHSGVGLRSPFAADSLGPCYLEASGLILQPGDTFPDTSGFCRLHKCIGSAVKNGKVRSRITIVPCVDLSADPYDDPTCRVVHGDPTQPFPGCCSREICDDDEEEFKPLRGQG